MANASSGEPLALRHGVVLYSAQVTYGTPVTPATAVGAALVGHTRHSGNSNIFGPGNAERRAVKGGSAWAEWTIRFPELQTGAKTLITKAARSSGVVPLITLGFGYSDDESVPNRSADQIQDAKVDTLRLSMDASGGHGPLSAELSGPGGLITELTSLAPNSLTSTPWWSYEAVLTRGGSAYRARTWELNLSNNISRDHAIPGAAPASFKRGHSFLTEHGISLSGSISRYERSGINVQADSAPTAAMQLVMTSLVDATTLTIALTNVDFDEERLDIDENGLFWSFNFTAQGITIS